MEGLLANGNRVQKRFSQPIDANTLVKTLKQQYPGASFEAEFCSFYPQRIMANLDVDCIIVNPSNMPTVDKEKHQNNGDRQVYWFKNYIEQLKALPMATPQAPAFTRSTDWRL